MGDDYQVVFEFKSKEQKEAWLDIFSDGGGECAFDEWGFDYSDWGNYVTYVDVRGYEICG